MNRDLNSQFGMKGHNSHFRHDGNLPLHPCLLWDAEQMCHRNKRDAYDRLYQFKHSRPLADTAQGSTAGPRGRHYRPDYISQVAIKFLQHIM